MQLQDAIDAGFEVTEIFVAEEGVLDPRWRGPGSTPAGIEVVAVSAPVLRALADTTTPQGVVAVVRIPPRSIAQLANPTMVVVLGDVRDPGNAGTLVRSAAAAGADAIVFPKGSVDPFAPKTTRAAAGALFQIPVIRVLDTVEAVSHLKNLGLAALAADAHRGTDLYESRLDRPFALVLGNEAWGLPPELDDLIDERVTIPMPGPTESLNVGIAGSVVLFEALRQRGPRPGKPPALS